MLHSNKSLMHFLLHIFCCCPVWSVGSRLRVSHHIQNDYRNKLHPTQLRIGRVSYIPLIASKQNFVHRKIESKPFPRMQCITQLRQTMRLFSSVQFSSARTNGHGWCVLTVIHSNVKQSSTIRIRLLAL